MKFLSRHLLLCLFVWGNSFAQNSATTINSSSCEKPAYPSASARLNEEGTVQLKFLVGVDGQVIQSDVEKSSGFRRLDEAARQGLSKCTFKPGMKDGVPVESWASMKYTWKLNVFVPCIGSDVTKWRSCLGTLSTSDGGLSVVEYEAGKKNGRGIEYDSAGKVIRAGIFDGEYLVSERNLDPKLYPFNAKLLASAPSIIQNKFSKCQGTQLSSWNNCFANFKSANGNSYFGEFVDGRMHGEGVYTYANGDKYSGVHKFGKANGSGEFVYADGRKFVGEFRDDKRNGKGIEYSSSGAVIRQGSWLDDKFEASFEIEPQTTASNISSFISATSVPTVPDISERERLALELAASVKKRQELEQQLRVAQQQSPKPSLSNEAERRVALVIGNATYKFNPLKNPVNDSTDMARSLRSVGFDVIEANNTTLAQMREATRRFADKLGNSDVGLVYYSGHGVEVKGKNYLIPVNADIKREYEVVDQAFDASQFLEMMDNIRGPNNKRVNILIVDACRNNELQKSWRSTNNGLARMDAPGGTFISFATAPGRVAADGAGRNSPYTKHLLQALKQPNVPIEQVFKVVRRNVMEETKGEQIPWENSSLVGDFYFTVQR